MGERRFRACVVREVTGSSPDSTHYFLSLGTIYLVLYELAILFRLLVLRTSQWAMEKEHKERSMS